MQCHADWFHRFPGEMAYHGHRVKLFDNNIDALNSAHERIEEDKKQLREEGLLSHKNFIVSNIKPLSTKSRISLLPKHNFAGKMQKEIKTLHHQSHRHIVLGECSPSVAHWVCLPSAHRVPTEGPYSVDTLGGHHLVDGRRALCGIGGVVIILGISLESLSCRIYNLSSILPFW